MNTQRNTVETVETRTAQITLESGIIWIKIKPGVQETLIDARANVAAVNQLCGAKSYPRLLDLREAMPLSREARGFYMQPEARVSATSLALVVESGVSRLIGNLIMGLIGARGLVRMFSDIDEAVQWLERFK